MSFYFLGTIFRFNTQTGSLTGLNRPSRQDRLLSEPQGSVSACPELGLQASINHHTHAVSQGFGEPTSSPFTNISSTESSHRPLKFPFSNQNILHVVTAKTVILKILCGQHLYFFNKREMTQNLINVYYISLKPCLFCQSIRRNQHSSFLIGATDVILEKQLKHF